MLTFLMYQVMSCTINFLHSSCFTHLITSAFLFYDVMCVSLILPQIKIKRFVPLDSRKTKPMQLTMFCIWVVFFLILLKYKLRTKSSEKNILEDQ